MSLNEVSSLAGADQTTLHHNQVSPGLSIGGHQLLIGYVYTVVPFSGVIICYYACIDILKSIYQIVR